ncbi:MAG: FAD-dependent oxidoreductase [Acidimicrobiales bacterium]
MDEAEFVVVGAGLLGLSTAWALSRRGHEVVVLEAAHVGHDGSGSKGTARIFRYGYDDPLYVGMAQEARALWSDLEAESGLELLETTGQLTFGADLAVLMEALQACEAPCELLAADEVARRYPGMVTVAEAVFEPDSGVLSADLCLQALRDTAGFALLEAAPVTAIRTDGDRVQVRASSVELSASVTVICAGPASSGLAQIAGTRAQTPTLEQVAQLPLGSDDMPVVINRVSPLLYALPVRRSSTIKVGLHGDAPPTDVASTDMSEDPVLLARVLEAAAKVLPQWEGAVLGTERCLYDNSPDEDFIVDRVGRVVIGAGTSGHGFKFGPLLGERLADLATGVPIPDGWARFRTGR